MSVKSRVKQAIDDDEQNTKVTSRFSKFTGNRHDKEASNGGHANHEASMKTSE